MGWCPRTIYLQSHERQALTVDSVITCVCNSKPCKTQSTTSTTSQKKIHTPGASKQHKSETTEVLWHDAGPVVAHPDDSSCDRPNSGEWLPKKGVASAIPTKMGTSNNSESIVRERYVALRSSVPAGTVEVKKKRGPKRRVERGLDWV